MAVPLLRTLILYCAVICAVRLMGKRQIGELDPSELVVTILVSDLAAVPMQDLGIPLLSGLVPIATLVVLEIFLSFAALKSRRFRRLLNGQPAIIIRRGQLDIDKLRQMRLTTDEVIETLRKQNVAAVSDVKYGVIEPDGTLTVILKQPQQPVTAAADYPATGAVAGTAATNNSATGNAADRATDEPAKPAKSSKPSISMSDLPDLRATFDPDAPLDDSSDRSRDEFTTVYDIIDSIEEELDEAKPILFAPSSVRVDRESFTGKLDKLKKMLPVQLERASALMRESERRLESAQTQANAIIASAQSRAADTVREANEQAQFLAGQENVTELARQKARGILDQAQAKADKLTQNADKYCITMMESLQQQVDKIGTGVQAGLNVLYDRQREAGAYLDHLDADDYPEN